MLPSDIWFEIFDHLHYFALNSAIPRTCKLFQSLVARRYNLTLCRDHPIKRNADTVYTLHPFLSVNSNSTVSSAASSSKDADPEITIFTQNVLFSFSTVIDDLGLCLSIKGRKWKVWHENAVSPATRNVCLRCALSGEHEDELRLASKCNAITVFNIMVAKLVIL